MSCQMAAGKGWDRFHLDLKTASFQGQTHHVNCDVVCQLLSEAGHPPYIAARPKKLAYGMNDALDAGGTFLTRHCVALTWFPHEPIDAVTCCTRHSRVSGLGNIGDKRPSRSSTAQETSLTKSDERSEMDAAFRKNAGSHSGKPSDRKIRDRNHQSLCG